jgi:hypothetical protein
MHSRRTTTNPRARPAQPIAGVATVARHARLFAAALLLQTAPSAHAPLAVTAAAPKNGDAVRVTWSVESRLTGTVAIGGAKLRDVDESSLQNCAFDARVSVTPTGAPSALVEYKPCVSKATANGDSSEPPMPTSERRFLVTLASGSDAASPPSDADRLVVHNAPPPADAASHGEPTPLSDKDEREAAPLVKLDVRELLLGGRLAPLLSTRKLEPGVAIELPAELAAELLGGAREAAGRLKVVSSGKCTLTPRETRRTNDVDGVVLAASIELTMKEGEELPVESKFSLAGEFVVAAATGRLLTAELAGPIRYGGSTEQAGKKIEVAGEGMLTWKYSAAPLPSP